MSEQRSLELSYPTVVGGAVAAATAAALSTRLGLVGTILGAALASAVSTVLTGGIASWIARLHTATVDREPGPWRGVLVGMLSVALVGIAFHTGWGLFTADLPRSSFAARMLAQLR